MAESVQGPSTERIKIKVKTMEPKTHELYVELNETVLSLKEKLVGLTDIPVERQRLICDGRALTDSSTLASSNIKEDHTLLLVDRPAGPPPTTNQPEPQGDSQPNGNFVPVFVDNIMGVQGLVQAVMNGQAALHYTATTIGPEGTVESQTGSVGTMPGIGAAMDRGVELAMGRGAESAGPHLYARLSDYLTFLQDDIGTPRAPVLSYLVQEGTPSRLPLMEAVRDILSSVPLAASVRARLVQMVADAEAADATRGQGVPNQTGMGENVAGPSASEGSGNQAAASPLGGSGIGSTAAGGSGGQATGQPRLRSGVRGRAYMHSRANLVAPRQGAEARRRRRTPPEPALVQVSGLALAQLLNRAVGYMSNTFLPSLQSAVRTIEAAVEDDPPEFQPVVVQAEDTAGRLFDVGGFLLELSRAANALSMAADGIPDPLVSNVSQFIGHDDVVEVPPPHSFGGPTLEAAMFGFPIYGHMPAQSFTGGVGGGHPPGHTTPGGQSDANGPATTPLSSAPTGQAGDSGNPNNVGGATMDWGNFVAGTAMQFPMGEIRVQGMPFGQFAAVPVMTAVPMGPPPTGHPHAAQPAPGQAASGQPSPGQAPIGQNIPGQHRPVLMRRQRPPPHPGQPEGGAPMQMEMLIGGQRVSLDLAPVIRVMGEQLMAVPAVQQFFQATRAAMGGGSQGGQQAPPASDTTPGGGSTAPPASVTPPNVVEGSTHAQAADAGSTGRSTTGPDASQGNGGTASGGRAGNDSAAGLGTAGRAGTGAGWAAPTQTPGIMRVLYPVVMPMIQQAVAAGLQYLAMSSQPPLAPGQFPPGARGPQPQGPPGMQIPRPQAPPMSQGPAQGPQMGSVPPMGGIPPEAFSGIQDMLEAMFTAFGGPSAPGQVGMATGFTVTTPGQPMGAQLRGQGWMPMGVPQGHQPGPMPTQFVQQPSPSATPPSGPTVPPNFFHSQMFFPSSPNPSAPPHSAPEGARPAAPAGIPTGPRPSTTPLAASSQVPAVSTSVQASASTTVIASSSAANAHTLGAPTSSGPGPSPLGVPAERPASPVPPKLQAFPIFDAEDESEDDEFHEAMDVPQEVEGMDKEASGAEVSGLALHVPAASPSPHDASSVDPLKTLDKLAPVPAGMQVESAAIQPSSAKTELQPSEPTPGDASVPAQASHIRSTGGAPLGLGSGLAPASRAGPQLPARPKATKKLSQNSPGQSGSAGLRSKGPQLPAKRPHDSSSRSARGGPESRRSQPASSTAEDDHPGTDYVEDIPVRRGSETRPRAGLSGLPFGSMLEGFAGGRGGFGSMLMDICSNPATTELLGSMLGAGPPRSTAERGTPGRGFENIMNQLAQSGPLQEMTNALFQNLGPPGMSRGFADQGGRDLNSSSQVPDDDASLLQLLQNELGSADLVETWAATLRADSETLSRMPPVALSPAYCRSRNLEEGQTGPQE
eukprot:jgi/Botrbrau1/9639/Bobra.0131s0016.1